MNLFQRIYVNVSCNTRYLIFKKNNFKINIETLIYNIKILHYLEIDADKEYSECAVQVTLKLEEFITLIQYSEANQLSFNKLQ